MKQNMTECGSLKIDDGGVAMMRSNAIKYSDNFIWYLYRWVPLFIMLGSCATVFGTVETNWKALEPKMFQMSQSISWFIPFKW